jgi:uncharacterized membrane protein YfcA
VDELVISPYLLAVMLFVVALLYSSVGLGGGSSYTAILTIVGASHVSIPTISLALNIIVTTVGSITFVRGDHARARLIWPFLGTSMPFAYLGGSLAVPKMVFHGVLLVTLMFVALHVYVWPETSVRLNLGRLGQLVLALFIGALLGLIAGIVGIGGGVFLVPLIIILSLGTTKEAAASGAIFTLVTSVAGFIARIQHHETAWLSMLPLLVAVLLGGILGSHLGAFRLRTETLQRLLGVIILLAIVLLARRIFLTAPIGT